MRFRTGRRFIMASEVALMQPVSSVEERDMERIKALIVASEKTLDDMAKQLGLNPDYVERLCFDIYDTMIIEERQNEKTISEDEMMKWLKENDLV